MSRHIPACQIYLFQMSSTLFLLKEMLIILSFHKKVEKTGEKQKKETIIKKSDAILL